MTARRRFFPASRALAVPGTTSYVHAQLRPFEQEPDIMPAACPLDIAGPALLPEWRYLFGTVYRVSTNGGEYETTERPQGNFRYSNGMWIDDRQYMSYKIVNRREIQHGTGYTLPACAFSADGRMTRAWVNLGEIKRPLRFRAVLLGRAMSDVKWTAELDTSAPWTFPRPLGQLWPDGVDVEDEGHSLLIRVHPGTAPQAQGNWAATLTMTAHAGGKPAGTLELRMGFRVLPLAEEVQTEAPYDFAGWEGWKPSD